MFQTKVVEKIKTNILCSTASFFCSLVVCEIMWENTAELGTSQKKILQSWARHRRKYYRVGHITEENTTEPGASQKKIPQSWAHHRSKYCGAWYITEKMPHRWTHHRRKYCRAGHITEENTAEVGTSQKQILQSLEHHRRKYCRAGHVTEVNMAQALCMLDTQGYKNTLRICNVYCFPLPTVAARKRLDVTLFSNHLNTS